MMLRSRASPPIQASAGHGSPRGRALPSMRADAAAWRTPSTATACRAWWVVDVDPVDLVDVHHTSARPARARRCAHGGTRAARRRAAWSGEAVDARACGVEDQPRDHHRPCQRPRAGLVDAGDARGRRPGAGVGGLRHAARITSRRRRARPAPSASRRRSGGWPRTAAPGRRPRQDRAATPALRRQRSGVHRSCMIRAPVSRRQDVGQRVAVDLEHAEAAHDRVRGRGDAVADHHRPLREHGFQRGGAGCQQHDVRRDHGVAGLRHPGCARRHRRAGTGQGRIAPCTRRSPPARPPAARQCVPHAVGRRQEVPPRRAISPRPQPGSTASTGADDPAQSRACLAAVRLQRHRIGHGMADEARIDAVAA